MTKNPDHLDKPIGLELGWERLDTRYPYAERMFQIRQDRVRLPQGNEIDYAYTETQGAVWIVPVTDDDQIILIRQYRYPPDAWCWEVPAGSLYDHTGSLEELAHRELREEVGAACENLVYVAWYYGGVSASNTVCHVMLARGTRLVGSPEWEETEFIEIHPVPIEQALAMARKGEMRDGRSALALLLCEPYLTE